MRFEDEIVRAVKHQAAIDVSLPKKSEEELIAISEAICIAVSSRAYDFSNSKSKVLTQSGGKKRFVKQFLDTYSFESVLCQCIKQILDRNFRIKYPNRNKTIRMLFDALRAVQQMSDFTIIKYDFKDYFNSVSVPYVFEKYIKNRLPDRFESDLIREFADQTRFAYAGFSTSNVISEIVAQQFDNAVQLSFSDKGILFFERYIDDSIIIINEHIEESECREVLTNILKTIFYDESFTGKPKCKTKFNPSKFIYITHRSLVATPDSPKPVDYLGYEFFFKYDSQKKQIALTYGITQTKQKKYRKRLTNLIILYTNSQINGVSNNDYHNIELLRHRIAAFTSREVYQSKRFRQVVWKIKGFIGNYGELRYLLETGLIESDTEHFLKNMVNEAFVNAGFTKLPYFLTGSIGKSGYNLFENMKKNKTLLFVEHIGYSEQALKKLCTQIGVSLVDKNGKDRGYGNIVRDYLIELKVGY